jgi:hypothetical protein
MAVHKSKTKKEKEFISITNDEVYKEFKEMKIKLNDIHDLLIEQNGKVTGLNLAVKWIYGIMGGVIIAMVAFIMRGGS